MATIILIGLLGAVISAVLGTFWYSEKTPMGKWHMTYLGVDKLSAEEKKKMIAKAMPGMWKVYLAQMILSFLTSLFIGFVTSYTVQNGGMASAVYYYVAMIWIAFVVPIMGQNLLWGNCEGSLRWKKLFGDTLYSLVDYLLIAFVATLFFK